MYPTKKEIIKKTIGYDFFPQSDNNAKINYLQKIKMTEVDLNQAIYLQITTQPNTDNMINILYIFYKFM